MSGGSYDYIQYKLEGFVGHLRSSHLAHGASKHARLRRAFADLMEKAALVAHEIEWCDSADTRPEDSLKALEKFFEEELHMADISAAMAWRDLADYLREAIEEE